MGADCDVRFYVKCERCDLEDESFAPYEFDPYSDMSLKDGYFSTMELKAFEGGWYLDYDEFICPKCWEYAVGLDVIDHENTNRKEDWIVVYGEMNFEHADKVAMKPRGR